MTATSVPLFTGWSSDTRGPTRSPGYIQLTIFTNLVLFDWLFNATVVCVGCCKDTRREEKGKGSGVLPPQEAAVGEFVGTGSLVIRSSMLPHHLQRLKTKAEEVAKPRLEEINKQLLELGHA